MSSDNILKQITKGALLQVESVSRPGYFAIATTFSPTGKPMVLAGPREQGNPTFLVAEYSYDGNITAKIVLRSQTAPAGFWHRGTSGQGFTNPVEIQPGGDTFILRVESGNQVSIQTSVAPPPPWVQLVSGPAPYLGAGFGAPIPTGFWLLHIVG
jgi:hypothetical protein